MVAQLSVRLLEQQPDLVLRRLGEVLVPAAHGDEGLQHVNAP
jgi:hypothetical protein